MAIQVYFDGALIRQLGAYVKTDLSAIRQVNGVATGVIGAVGLAEAGMENVAYTVTSHAEAVAIFKSGPLVDHIKTMFLGGAGQVIAVRIGNPTSSEFELSLTDGTDPFTLDFASLEESARSNSILVQFDFDESGTAGAPADDVIVLTVMQKNPDCTVVKEIYEFPRQFTTETVVYKRGDSLYFVQDYIIEPAIKALLTTNPNPNPEDKKAVLADVLADMLLPDDSVQFFNVNEDIPIGLMLYEVNQGGLFGYERSRITSLTLNGTAFDTVFDIVDAFDGIFAPFYNPSTAQSEFSTFVKTDITMGTFIDENPNTLSEFYALSGGTNGDDGTGFYGTGAVTATSSSPQMLSWVSGLQVLENEEVNFVQPCYQFASSTEMGSDAATTGNRELFFNAVIGYVLAHTKLMSSVSNRKRRTSIIGFPAPNNGTYSKTEYLTKAINNLTALTSDTDRVQDWIAPFYSSVITGTRQLLGGEFLASYIAGRHANAEPQISLTFNSVGSLGAEWLYDWTYSEKDRLILQRKSFVEKVKNSFGSVVYRIHHNPTAYLGAVTTGYQEFILRRIDDFVSTYLFKNVEEAFIGQPSFGARTSQQISRYVSTLLGNLVNNQIVAYADVNVTSNEDNTVYNVEFRVQPITEIKFILMTMQIDFSLE